MSEELQEALDGFFLAAEYGRSDVIKALADHSRGRLPLADVVDPVTGRSPLHVAVASGKKDALRVLLAAGFPPDHQSKKQKEKDQGNRSAYALAQGLKDQDLLLMFHQFLIQQVAANDMQSVNQLLAAGVDVGVTDAATGGSLLHWAVSCQALDVMKGLLEKEDVQRLKLVDARNGEGATPMHLACHANQVECVNMLLAHHADVSLRGDKGLSKDKTAFELATKPEVIALLSQYCKDGSDKVEESHLDGKTGNARNVEKNEGKLCPSPATIGEQGGWSGTCIHEVQNGKLLLQLEEKDLLVNQLKNTIETLVQELQESQMLGDERVMLNYVRKLRNEKTTIQRQLEDGHEHIKDQQQQLNSLKEQIRQMSSFDKQLETDHDILSHTSDGTTSSTAGCPPDTFNTEIGVLECYQREKYLDEEDTESETFQGEALNLDAWTSKAQREQETFNRYVEKHGSDIWSTVWNGIWTGAGETADADDEIVMTV
ncbi:unnamed protein product [Peronospora effusa]|uniref:Uncharacterized protein n=1 Tax=Peronospora effusa TaxID=542832 RepID=A0A3M6VMU6_9STRA|nr:hypothetical protein DD238_008402 [Peronospora effusa]CAI5700522.1 unnamed protein product [Peronospora effusa]CAI5700525.1 unnamed protein product [Peronospora effusa]